MSEKRPCIRCEREIDTYAKICPYCNWDQTQTNIPPPSQQPVADAYVPPAERNWKRHIMIAVGGVGLLILSFFVGALINSDAAPEEAPAPVVGGDAQTAAQVAPAKRADVTLVPVTDIEAPITTAPVAALTEGIPTEYQRSDATAVSSVEYAQLAARAQEEKRRNAALVDPRSLTGPAYAQAQARRPAAVPSPAPIPPPQTSADNGRFDERQSRPDPPSSSSESNDEPARVATRTRPIPVSQPLPSITVDRDVTARLELTVGPDGRVKAVNLREGIPGHTAKLIASVQQWRFKPATENGVPVSAPFTVDISFRGND
jgi:periplasmic protein TonB